ncbi:MAG: ElyC/SanA/YdcF family protein [Anaerolineaceae bacterium]|nr:ElyC/SanA/YdcF family protein [Anaerolineaceae bacterium]MDD4043073.1 ElyC/SanA/YdcF family protein [Anaerolineaceae bacterium]MDD4576947.1 ElyC/SanA/YdcF family protein [Anaerolineaceae bacterium]
MVSILRDFFIQLLNPLAFVSVVLFISLFLIKKKPNTAIWFVAISLAIIAIFGNIFFSSFLTRSMEWRYMPNQAMEKADAILLMADGTLESNTPRQRVEVEGKADGVLYSAMYYQQNLAPVIVVSGNLEAAESARILLMELGVPQDAIILQNDASNMREDVAKSLDILQAREVSSVILVTTALKMDRTMFLLRDSGLIVTPAPVDYQVTLNDWQNLTDWNWKQFITNIMPTSSALDQTFSALWEYFGLAFYRVKSLF